MKNIRGIELNEGSREEVLPGFEAEFPYISSCVELEQFINPIIPWHWHRTVELFYMESGCLEYTTPNGKWIFPQGSGGFVNSNVLHTTQIQSFDGSNVQLLHLFEPSLLSGEHGSRVESKYILPLTTAPQVEIIPLYPENPAHARILTDIQRAFDISDQDWGYEFTLRDTLSQIWLKLFELVRPALKEEYHGKTADDQIKTLMVYIHEHYREPISVDQLAESAHISKRVCFRLFQENLHMTPVEYMRSYRLQKACQMLIKTKETITRIAYACGLGSSSYFGKIFRERFGCSPIQYRKKWHDCDSFRRI